MHYLPTIPFEVHLPPLSLLYRKKNNSRRTTPVIGFWRPRVHLAGIDGRSGRIAAIHRAIRWLDVERRRRYMPAAGKTYCNIYAYDLTYLLGSYIPRVWWKPEAMDKVLRGESVEIVYGKTVREMNTNALVDWWLQYGSHFSWEQFSDLDKMQNTVNDGHLGFIIAQPMKPDSRGHITVVVPETGSLAANRHKNIVVSPLQSQAGAKNVMYFSDTAWWADAGKFKSFYFWVWKL